MERNILENQYKYAKEIVDSYEQLLKNSSIKKHNLSINDEVLLDDKPEIYWISEIKETDILIRTTYSEYNFEYDEYWISIWRLKKV